MAPLVWHNQELESTCLGLPDERWRIEDLEQLETTFAVRGTLAMTALSSGLFPAAAMTDSAALKTSGYGNVWVRDNVYVAYAYHLCGRSDIAARAMGAIFGFYAKHRRRFYDIIEGKVSADEVMLRPHVRFDGESLEELSERWSHAQNDALGYAMWLFARLAAARVLALDEVAITTLIAFVQYFKAIRYWEDEDSGHWEEARKRSASSIGTVVAGLEGLLTLARGRGAELKSLGLTTRLVDVAADLVARGRAALDEILPNECVQLSPRHNRRYDAALIFLVHPLAVVGSPHVEMILSDVNRFLSGPHGIRRYLGDSYYAPDYEERLPPEVRTRDFSLDMETRDALLDSIGHEAQWCIFDSVLSALFGVRYARTAAASDLEAQTAHFERSLAQITREWRCPELYYRKGDHHVVGPHTPLLWAQANLMLALAGMRESLRA
jgi:phosphorylase kinase alpha/beta subunit